MRLLAARRLDVREVKYECSRCKVSGVRLWRDTQMLASLVTLYCLPCGLDHERGNMKNSAPARDLAGHLDSGCLGYLVAARPVDDSFWGHCSGPEESVMAWRALPFSPPTPHAPPGQSPSR